MPFLAAIALAALGILYLLLSETQDMQFREAKP